MSLTRFLFFLLAFLALNAYLFIRGWQALPDRRMAHTIYSVFFLGASLSIFAAIFAGGRLPLWLSFVFEQVGGYWVILFIYMVAAAILGDLLRGVDHFFNIFPEWVTLHYPQVKMGYFIIVVLFLGILSFVGFSRFSHPRFVELNLRAGNDTSRSAEITMVAISDLHLGNVVRKRRLIKWVRLINSQKPDIIFLAGDIFDHSYQAVESQQMGQELGLLQAPYGVYAIPGNHDYYTGVENAMAYLKHSGIRILRDSTVVIDNRFVVIGRDDITNRNRKTLASLMTGMDTKLPKIVLDHQPHSLAESVENHIDLHLSGHTHNGQIFPFNRIVSKIYELSYGYRKTGNTHFYVSSGIGLWGAPIRLGTQSEIVKIHLTIGGK
jgi:uncharacterized protein